MKTKLERGKLLTESKEMQYIDKVHFFRNIHYLETIAPTLW